MDPLSTHRISIEERSNIYLLFYETLITSEYVQPQENGSYKQQLLRIFKDFKGAEAHALQMKIDRHINTEIIVRDDSQRNVMLREA